MTSLSLVSSLFRDNSGSLRSASLFQTAFRDAENNGSGRARSQSSHKNRITDYSGKNKLVPLVRVVLTLQGKIRIIKQSFFCLMEQQSKRAKHHRSTIIANQAIQPKISTSTQNIGLSNQNRFDPSATTKPNDNRFLAMEQINSSLQLIQHKRWMEQSMASSFNCIKKHSQKVQAISRLFLLISSLCELSLKSLGFQSVARCEKYCLRSEICCDALCNVFQNRIQVCFLEICQWKRGETKAVVQGQETKITMKSSNKGLPIILPVSSDKQTLSEAAGLSSETEQPLKEGSLTISEQSVRMEHSAFDQDPHSKGSECEKNKIMSYHQAYVKHKTAVHASRPRMKIPSAYKVSTSLEEQALMQHSNYSCWSVHCVNKQNRLHPEEFQALVPDMHDHIGVFDQCQGQLNRLLSDNQSESEETLPNKFLSTCRSGSLRAINCSLKSDTSKVTNNKYSQHTQQKSDYFTDQTNQIFKMLSEQLDKQYSTKQQYPNKQSTTPRQLRILRQQTTPLHKISQMIMELNQLEKEKKYQKIINKKQKCQMTANLPVKRLVVKSQQTSLKKKSWSHMGTQLKSDKKTIPCKKEDSGKKFYAKQEKENRSKKAYAKQDKENIEVRLWDDKEKLLFCPGNKQQAAPKPPKKYSLGGDGITEKSLVSTARKMKKEIEGIMSRNSRTSQGILKILPMNS